MIIYDIKSQKVFFNYAASSAKRLNHKAEIPIEVRLRLQKKEGKIYYKRMKLKRKIPKAARKGGKMI